MSKLNINKVFGSFENDFKDEILEIINYNFDDNSLDDLIYYLEDCINDNGSIDETIDSNIDIYYYDLRKWSVENYDYIDQGLNEFGSDETDFHKIIQLGQYVYYSELIYECINDMIDHIKGVYNV